MGDSISAHFHIPEQWLDATQINEEVFKHVLYIIENELDWPQLSASTGNFFYIFDFYESDLIIFLRSCSKSMASR